MTFGEKQTDPLAKTHWRGDMQADYFYPAGVAGDKFFKHLKENDSFLATHCKKCDKTLFPARLYCEDCFEEILDEDWKQVPATGVIRLFTIATLNAHAEKLENPKVMALIDIDETDGASLGIINLVDLKKDYSGLKVKAVLKPKDKREGTMKDIIHWELI